LSPATTLDEKLRASHDYNFDEEEGDDEDDEDLAWSYLNKAREMYSEAIEKLTTTEDKLTRRLSKELARVLNRLGDLNMFTKCWGDAVVEYDMSIKIRERDQESIECICHVCDSKMQVAFAHLSHLEENGVVEITVETEEGNGRIVIASSDKIVDQMLSYRDSASSAMNGLVSRLAHTGGAPSNDEKEMICVQYELISEFKNRFDALQPTFSRAASPSESS